MARRRRKAVSGPPSLLILQLDADKLRADGLLLSDLARFVAVVTKLASGATVVTKETRTLRHLLGELGELARERSRFDVIVVVGHSNHTGIRVASDSFAEWDEFAAYLKLFEPRRLMLVACQAGRWPAAAVLFKRLSKLRRIFASPVNTSKDLATLMIAIVPYLVEVKAPDSDLILKAQAWAMALTGRQVRHWMKKDKDKPEGQLLDLVSQHADPLIREIHGAVRRLFR